MAFKVCPVCGRKVSMQMDKCIDCGYIFPVVEKEKDPSVALESKEFLNSVSLNKKYDELKDARPLLNKKVVCFLYKGKAYRDVVFAESNSDAEKQINFLYKKVSIISVTDYLAKTKIDVPSREGAYFTIKYFIGFNGYAEVFVVYNEEELINMLPFLHKGAGDIHVIEGISINDDDKNFIIHSMKNILVKKDEHKSVHKQAKAIMDREEAEEKAKLGIREETKKVRSSSQVLESKTNISLNIVLLVITFGLFIFGGCILFKFQNTFDKIVCYISSLFLLADLVLIHDVFGPIKTLKGTDFNLGKNEKTIYFALVYLIYVPYCLISFGMTYTERVWMTFYLPIAVSILTVVILIRKFVLKVNVERVKLIFLLSCLVLATSFVSGYYTVPRTNLFKFQVIVDYNVEEGTILGVGYYEKGSKVSLVAHSHEQYTFSSYNNLDGSVITTNYNYVIPEITEDIHIKAIFSAKITL